MICRLKPNGEVEVVCGDCCGAGYVVADRLSQVYGAVSAEWVSTGDIAKRVGITGENAANNLKRLHGSDLVERRGSGARHSPYEWRRAAQSDLPNTGQKARLGACSSNRTSAQFGGLKNAGDGPSCRKAAGVAPCGHQAPIHTIGERGAQ